MRFRQFRNPIATMILGIALIGAMAPSALAQDHPRGSGLFTRFQPPTPKLPADRDRDTFYGSRYDNPDASPAYKFNCPKRGGLYGQHLPTNCTTCYSPYFRGQAGGSIGPECVPSHPKKRLLDGIFHPLKPIGHYYGGGCWVPKYDLDPWVIGPDNFPYPFKQDHLHGG